MKAQGLWRSTLGEGLRFLFSFVILSAFVSAAFAANTVLVPTGDTWRYSNTATPPGEGWNKPSFADGEWKFGLAELGYGDGDEATVTDGGELTPHPITAYFRREFLADGPEAFSKLVLRLKRDDGAVVYLNGTEVLRRNMPDGVITPETLALETIAFEGELTFSTNSLASGLLVNGTNLLAVEIHQVNASSSDISFDAELVGVGEDDAPPPVVSIFALVPVTIEPSPTTKIAPGRFLVSRSGPVSAALSVSLRYEGTATPGTDYQELPAKVEIPAGARSAQIVVAAQMDNLQEETETVIARLRLPEVITANGAVVQDTNSTYRIEEGRGSATVRILNQPNPARASIEITDPKSGETFPAGADIGITAVAIDPSGYIAQLVFYANNSLIGTSRIDFIRAPDPGTPIEHHIIWSNAPAGEHALTARAMGISSEPVRIVVGPALPVVSLEATRPVTSEPLPNALVTPGLFTLKRTGDAAQSLSVAINYGGTATSGTDYTPLPRPVVFPAGTNEVRLQVLANSDALVEGDETVVAELSAPPTATGAAPQYQTNPERRRAVVTIRDEDRPLSAKIEITKPEDEQRFLVGANIEIEAVAMDPNVYISKLEFFAGDKSLGISEVVFVTAPTNGTPIHHSIVWSNAPAGLFELTAVSRGPGSPDAVSAPVHIVVRYGTPLVTIEATQPMTSEPLSNSIVASASALVAPGVFTLKKFGETDPDVPVEVMVRYGGTAKFGVDYQEMLQRVSFPPGSNVVTLQVIPLSDDLSEGPETVEADIQHFYVDWIPYETDPDKSKAVVTIQDEDRGPYIRITKPAPDTSVAYHIFSAGSNIEIEATAVDPDGYIPRVEFYIGDSKIGVSEITFVTAPTNGTPIHHSMVWSNAPAGEHILTAQGVTANGTKVVSEGVKIRVRSIPDRDLPIVSVRFREHLTKEAWPDADFAPGSFEFQRTGPTNGTLRVFYRVSDVSIPEIRLATPGEDYKELRGSVLFEAGQAVVNVRVEAIDDELVEGKEAVHIALTQPPTVDPVASLSPVATYRIDPEHNDATVYILDNDQEPPAQVVLAVEVKDGEASEADVTAALNPGVLLIKRVGGPTNVTVVALYEMSGAASNGVDYAKLSGSAELPPGKMSVEVRINAIYDKAIEGDETAILTLVSPPCIAIHPPPPDCYLIGEKNSGRVVIKDAPVRPEFPVVSIRFLEHMTDEVWPDEDFAPGSFEVRRTGPTNEALTVYYFTPTNRPAGTDVRIATPGADYVKLPGNITIPKGESAATFKVQAIDDKFVEGPEQVIASLIPIPPNLDPVISGVYEIDLEHKSASLTIVDNDKDPFVILAMETTDGVATEPGEAEFTSLLVVDGGRAVIKRIGGPIDVAVRAQYEISGTASNGVDYVKLSGVLELGANQEKAEIRVFALMDNAVEGEETVVLKLVPPVCPDAAIPMPSCYQVDSNNTSRIVIRDRAVSNRPPQAHIAKPKRGAVFVEGDVIEIVAEASDPDGRVVKLEVFADGESLGSAETNRIVVRWDDASIGEHRLKAVATDNLGKTGDSDTVPILVRKKDAVAFVIRELPDAYTPGTAFEVELKANPPEGSNAYAVEDRPPTGWRVSEISHNGLFDEATGKVKFGPFTDGDARELTYRVLPPTNAVGRREFVGVGSIDGASIKIGGDHVIERASTEHPADVNADFRLVLNEVTAYAGAWKNGDEWPSGPNPIPLSYVTRAGFLWQHGEVYGFDGSLEPPRCWVPTSGGSGGGDIQIASINAGENFRYGGEVVRPGVSAELKLRIDAPSGTTAYAVEEEVPSGWTVSNISHNGEFDATSGRIRWGVFFDSTARELSYTITPPANVAEVGKLRGYVSFDGNLRILTGRERMISVEDDKRPWLERCDREEGGVRLRLGGEPGQAGVLQRSADLQHWEDVSAIFLPDGTAEVLDEGAEARLHLYYRLQVR